MSGSEFSIWLKDYQNRCWANVVSFVRENGCQEVWQDDLKEFTLVECLEANKTLRGADCPKFENVPLAVAQEASKIRRKNAIGSVTDNPVSTIGNDDSVATVFGRFIDGKPTFSCQHCMDKGIVSVVAPKTIKEALVIIRNNSDLRHFPVTFCSVYCNCMTGRQTLLDWARRKWSNYGNRVDEYAKTYQYFGESKWHIKNNLIQDDMPCPSCSKSKTLADWHENGMSELICRNCKHVFRIGDKIRPKYEAVLVHVHRLNADFCELER